MLQGHPQRILENINTAVLTLDGDLHLTSINPAGEMMFEISSKQIVGQDVRKFLPGEQPLVQNLRTALAAGHPFTNRGTRLDFATGNSITVDYTVTPLTDGESCTELLVEVSQIDRLLRIAREENMLDRHAANRAVLKGLAHEIKNPLGGLSGAAQLLQRELPDRALAEYTRIIIHEADRLRNLVDRMMGSTRPLRNEPVNIHRILEHVASLISVEFPPGVTIKRDYDPSVPDVKGDSDQITQAVLNIVRNSAQAVAGRGIITLRTRVERKFTIGHVSHRLVLRTDIEDDGPGIPGQLVDHIFYPMVSDKADGSGLGLSISQDILNNHGGFIACKSEPGRTVFSIYLLVENGNDQ